MGTEMIIRVDDQVYSMFLVGKGNLLLYNVVVALCILLNNACRFDCLYKHAGAAAHDRSLGPVNLNQRVVYAHPGECSQNVLYCCH